MLLLETIYLLFNNIAKSKLIKIRRIQKRLLQLVTVEEYLKIRSLKILLPAFVDTPFLKNEENRIHLTCY